MSVLSTMISLMMKAVFAAAFALVFFFSVMCAVPFVATLTALASSTKAPSRVFVVCVIEVLGKMEVSGNMGVYAKIAFSALFIGTFPHDKLQKTL